MKTETTNATLDVEKLGELLDEFNLDDDADVQEKKELERKLSNLSLDGTDTDESSGSFFVLDGPRKKAAVQNKDDEESEKSSDCQKVRTRGPVKGQPPKRTTQPYNIPVTSIPHKLHGRHTQLFHAGGDVFTPAETAVSQWQFQQAADALIPDFSQILPDSFLVLENTVNLCKDLPISLGPDEALTQDDEALDKIFKEFCNQSPDDLPILDKEFLESLDPENDSTSDIGTFDTVDENTSDRFTPLSIDAGYWSNTSSPESTSGLSSVCPSPPLPSPPLPSPPPQMSTGSRRIKRNKYFEGLDEKLCDKYHRIILKKANDKEHNGLNEKDNNNGTMLHVAIQRREIEYTVVLLNMLQKSFQNGTGTPASFKDLPSYLNQTDDGGRTPLLLACLYDVPRILEYLLDCGASPILGAQFMNGTVLHYLCQRGARFLNEANIICSKSSECLLMPDSDLETPLHIAVACHGNCHLDAISRRMETVDNASIIELLLNNNARLSVQDRNGLTPLHLMIMKKNFALLEVLHSKARDWKEAVNLQNKNGRTILHSVARYADMDVNKQRALIQDLLARDADPRIRDVEGKRAIDLVPEDRKQHLQILRFYYEGNAWKAVDDVK